MKIKIFFGMICICLAVSPSFAQTSTQQSLQNGIKFTETKQGSGNLPNQNSNVTVTYKGTFTDGKVFDESTRPISFKLTDVIPCWTIALQKMKAGSSATIYCPSEVAYGQRGFGSIIPPNSPLNFTVNLISFTN